MRVKLLQNILEGGGVKVSIRHRMEPAVAKDADGNEQTVYVRKPRETVFVKGAIIEMSDASERSLGVHERGLRQGGNERAFTRGRQSLQHFFCRRCVLTNPTQLL